MQPSIFALPLLLLPVVDLAWAGPRTIIPAESQIAFTVKEMGVPVRGAFKRFDAAIDIDPTRPEQSTATLRIDTGSLTTGNEEADAIAVNADWLDAAHAHDAIFSSSIRMLAPNQYEAKGTLSIRNRTRDIAIRFTSSEDAAGKQAIVSDFVIKRSDFGVGGGEWNQGGVVAEDVPVSVRLVLAPAPARVSAASR